MQNFGANCKNCRFEGGHNSKQCRKCATKDGRPGWEPAPGIKVRYGETYSPPDWKAKAYREVIGGNDLNG